MLIKTPISVGDVVSIRLITGEEIIGYLIEETPSQTCLRKPMILQMHKMPDGSIGLGFSPTMVSAGDNDHVTVMSTSMVYRAAKTQSEIKDHYIKATSGILTPSAGGLITG